MKPKESTGAKRSVDVVKGQVLQAQLIDRAADVERLFKSIRAERRDAAEQGTPYRTTLRHYRVTGSVTSLRLAISETGGMTWFLRVRPRGAKPVTDVLGTYDPDGGMSLAQARDAAQESRNKARRGVNPVEERRALVAAAQAAKDAEEERRRRAETSTATTIGALSKHALSMWEDDEEIPRALTGKPALVIKDTTLSGWRSRIRLDVLPYLADRQATDFTPADVERWAHTQVGQRPGKNGKPGKRINNVGCRQPWGALSSIFDWAAEQQLIPRTNPFATAKMPASWAPRERQRYLDRHELQQLLIALRIMRRFPKGALGAPPLPARTSGATPSRSGCASPARRDQALMLQLLLLTGVRRANVRQMQATEFDLLDRPREATWEIPGEKMKQKRTSSPRPHLVPLSRQASAIIRHRIDHVGVDDTGHLFATVRRSHRRKNIGTRVRPVSYVAWNHFFMADLYALVARLHERAQQRKAGTYVVAKFRRERPAYPVGVDSVKVKVKPWSTHTIRHTIATHLSAAHAGGRAVSLILAHSHVAAVRAGGGAAITATYDKARLIGRRRQLLQEWANYLDRLGRYGVEPEKLRLLPREKTARRAEIERRRAERERRGQRRRIA
jgi:integrase